MPLAEKHFSEASKQVHWVAKKGEFWGKPGAIAAARRLYVRDEQSTRSLVVYGDVLYAAAVHAKERTRRGIILGTLASFRRRDALDLIKDLDGKIHQALLDSGTTAEQCERFAIWYRAAAELHFPSSETECRGYWFKAVDSVNCGIEALRLGKGSSASVGARLWVLATELYLDRPSVYPGREAGSLQKAIEAVDRIPDASEQAPVYLKIADVYARMGAMDRSGEWRDLAEELSGE